MVVKFAEIGDAACSYWLYRYKCKIAGVDLIEISNLDIFCIEEISFLNVDS